MIGGTGPLAGQESLTTAAGQAAHIDAPFAATTMAGGDPDGESQVVTVTAAQGDSARHLHALGYQMTTAGVTLLLMSSTEVLQVTHNRHGHGPTSQRET